MKTQQMFRFRRKKRLILLILCRLEWDSHMQCISFDLPPVCPIALENISKMGLASKVKIVYATISSRK